MILNNKIMEYPINTSKEKKIKNSLLDIYKFIIDEMKPDLVNNSEFLSFNEYIQIILEKKRNSIEKDLIPSNKILNSYIELKMNELDKFLSSFIFKQQRDSQLLNEFFIQEVNQE